MVVEPALIEDAVKLLLSGAPAEWVHLHSEFEWSPVPTGTAVVSTAGAAQPVAVTAGVIGVLTEHQRRSAAVGCPWQRLVVDCYADGRLSARAEPGVSALVEGAPRRRWLRPVLATITLGCLAAAVVVFAVGWRWGPPPRVAMIAVPAVSPRQQEAFEVVSQWFDAENREDVAGMRAVVCANPSQSVQDWLSMTGYFGQDQGFVFPDAVDAFQDDGARVWVRVAVRIRPVDEKQKREVAEQQKHGGFFEEKVMLADEGGTLKVCDIYLAPG